MRAPALAALTGVVGLVVGYAAALTIGISTTVEFPLPSEPSLDHTTVAGVAYAPAAWKVLDIEGTGYRLSYPRDFDLAFNVSGASQLTDSATRISFPQDAFAQGQATNYAEAWISLTSSRAAKDVAACLNKTANPREKMTETQQLGGTTFMVEQISDAGAGNLYESTVRRAVVSGECLEITTTLHTTNLGNYDPGTVAAFDQAKANALFSAVLETFTLRSPQRR